MDKVDREFERVIATVNYIDEIKRLGLLEKYEEHTVDEFNTFWELMTEVGNNACSFADERFLVDALKERLIVNGIVADEEKGRFTTLSESEVVDLQQFLERQIEQLHEDEEGEEYQKKKAAKEREKVKEILLSYISKLQDEE